MKIFRMCYLLLLLFIHGCGNDEDLGPVNGQLVLGGEAFQLGASTLVGSTDLEGFFSISLYPAGTVLNLDQFDRPNIVSRADVEGADFQIWGLNSPGNRLEAGEYLQNFTASNDFEFSGAEILIRRNASGGAGIIIVYEFSSGTLSVDAVSNTNFSLSWDMIFVNDDDPTDIVSVTGNYQGTYLFSEF